MPSSECFKNPQRGAVGWLGVSAYNAAPRPPLGCNDSVLPVGGAVPLLALQRSAAHAVRAAPFPRADFITVQQADAFVCCCSVPVCALFLTGMSLLGCFSL